MNGASGMTGGSGRARQNFPDGSPNNEVEWPPSGPNGQRAATLRDKTMVLKIVLAVVAVVVALLIYAATRPNSFRVQRSTTINATPEKVFPFINDLRSWDAWSSDTGGNKTVQKIYSGPARGRGAAAEWNGSGRDGAAKMTIVESVAPSKVSVQVDWVKPFKAHNLNEFTFQARGEETEVEWSIQASNLYAMKVIGIFVDIPSEFGKHMESGLKNLKRVVEK